MRGVQAKMLRGIAQGLAQNQPTEYVIDRRGIVRVHPHSWRSMYKRLKANFHRIARKEASAMSVIQRIREAA